MDCAYQAARMERNENSTEDKMEPVLLFIPRFAMSIGPAIHSGS